MGNTTVLVCDYMYGAVGIKGTKTTVLGVNNYSLC